MISDELKLCRYLIENQMDIISKTFFIKNCYNSMVGMLKIISNFATGYGKLSGQNLYIFYYCLTKIN